MLPKKNKVEKNFFERVFKQGRSINSPHLTFKFLFDDIFILPRVSFVVPKKFAKTAVMRNRLKRRGYNIFKKYINNLPKNLCGAFIFGKDSTKIFYKSKSGNIDILEDEIKVILNKLI